MNEDCGIPVDGHLVTPPISLLILLCNRPRADRRLGQRGIHRTSSSTDFRDLSPLHLLTYKSRFISLLEFDFARIGQWRRSKFAPESPPSSTKRGFARNKAICITGDGGSIVFESIAVSCGDEIGSIVHGEYTGRRPIADSSPNLGQTDQRRPILLFGVFGVLLGGSISPNVRRALFPSGLTLLSAGTLTLRH